MRSKSAIVLAILALSLLGARRRPSMSPPPRPVPTFSKEVVRIFQQHCQSCHHAGDIAPFPLMTYNDAAGRAADIKYVTGTRYMPPWRAAAGCGEFAQERKLTKQEIDTLAQWAEGGAPEGDRAELPTPKLFTDGWAAGVPDLVLAMTRPFTPPADRDEYRCYSIPVNATKDLEVGMLDFRPGDRGTVHHIIPFLDPTGASAKLDRDGNGYQCFGGPGFRLAEPLGAWSPGARPAPLPDGTAIVIPKGSRVVFQVHYHPHFGKVLPDQTEIGLYFSTVPLQHHMYYDAVLTEDIEIPAGAKDTRIDAEDSVPANVHLISIYPHMHLLGRTMKVEALLPDGTKSCMIDVPDYAFNWQGAYVYREPLALPAGTRLHVEAHYDNSEENLSNPNSPPKTVRWGEASTDEMCVALFGYTLDDE